MAKPIHEIMAESSAGLARQNARRKAGAAGRLPNTAPPGRDFSGITNPNLRGPAVGNTAGRGRWTSNTSDNVNAMLGGMNKSQQYGYNVADSYSPQNLWQMIQDARDAGNEDEAETYQSDLEMRYPTLANSNPVETNFRILQGMTPQQQAEYETKTAKVYGIGDEGMINDPWYGSPRLSDEANAINQALDFARNPNVKAMKGISPSTLRGALGNELYKKNPEMYRNMLPRNILNQLPADAFETQDDWLNQQPITMI